MPREQDAADRQRDDDGSREDPLLSGVGNAITAYRPDVAALTSAPTRVVIAAGAESYPITAPTFIIVRTKYDDAKKAELVKGFLNYLLNDGQDLAEENSFAPLPADLKTKALAQLDKVS